MPFYLFIVLFTSLALGGNQLRKEGFSIGAYQPGKGNHLSDVPGVRVGHATLIRGHGKLSVGKGPVRTGVTVVIPEGDLWKEGLPVGVFTFNGVGEAMGFANAAETGLLQTPIALTNTLSVGDVQKALAKWVLKKHPKVESLMPVVMECDDSSLNDIQGYHVKDADVLKAIEAASAAFGEGAVGAGTGMISFDFKSGIGSSSRTVSLGSRSFTVGVLVNANIGTGTRSVFRMLGMEVAKHVVGLAPLEKPWSSRGSGSIVTVVATDAPLDARQLGRLAKRSFSGVLRLGTPGYNGSGDFTLAFSTLRAPAKKPLGDGELNSFFEAAADATEEAVLNSLLSAAEMTGRDGNHVYALPMKDLKPLVTGYKAK